MYIPKAFKVEERDKLVEFIKGNSFGILFSNNGSLPMATHLPLLFDEDAGENGYLFGHMARANPHWKETSDEVMVVFHGPHSYISPTWYEDPNTVPTWNYVAVHAYGDFIVVEDKEGTKKIIEDTVNFYESSMPKPWKADFTEEYIEGLMKGIVCFSIKVNKLEGKWKLNQNHPVDRQRKVVQALRKNNDQNTLGIANLMEMNINQKR
jgi:transcriptional regulator